MSHSGETANFEVISQRTSRVRRNIYKKQSVLQDINKEGGRGLFMSLFCTHPENVAGNKIGQL
jgi:hypothetical protein